MKKLQQLFLLLGIITLAAGCAERVEDTVTYNVNEPVLMTKAAFRSSVKVSEQPQPIVRQGKICFYKGYLYISEPEKGIHILDNRDVRKPINVGFIELIGNADVAVRNDVLYADSFVDMVWFDVSNPAKPSLLGRKTDMFPYALPATNNFYGCDWEKMNAQKETSIIVGWKVAERTVPVEKSSGVWWGWGRATMDGMFTANLSKNESVGSSSTGVNGSMSRLIFYNDYLYSVFNNQMSIFKFNGKEPVKATDDKYIGSNVETIFSYKDNLFMGTPTGMLIYSVADPLKPVYQSSLQHVYGCDPVVVENDVAYVTVRSGNNCGQNQNQLIIIDVKDVKSPKALATYAMTHPKGLAVNNGTLYLCDDGLKVFNAANPQTIIANRLAHFKNMDGFDVIVFNDVLMMIAAEGIYQYDCKDVKNITFLSKFSFVK